MEKGIILLGCFLAFVCTVEARHKKEKTIKVVRWKRQAADTKKGPRYENAITSTVYNYATDFAKKNKVELDWVDIRALHDEARENNATKLDLQMSEMKYEPGQVKGEGRRDDGVVLYTNLFCNDQKRQNISAIISKTLNRTATFSWQMDESKFSGLDVELDLQIPADLNNMAEFSTSANLKDKTKVEASTVDTFNVRDQVTVAPKTATKAIWILSERKMTFPFRIEATLKGDIAMKFKAPVNGKTVVVHPIKSIESMKSPDFLVGSNGDIMMIIKGQFKGIRGLSTNLRTKSHPLKNTACKDSGKLFLKKQT